MPPEKEEIRFHFVNVDLSLERQNSLKEGFAEQFAGSNQRQPDKNFKMIFITNQENRPLSGVLVANSKADIICCGFNVTKKLRVKEDRDSENALVTETTGSDLQIDPTIRFQAYRELLNITSRESFQQRRLFFVGNLNERIREFLKYGFVVQARFFTDKTRQQTTPFRLLSAEMLPHVGNPPEQGQLEVGDIDQLKIGEILFHGVIHQLEEKGRIYCPDFTGDDSFKKVLLLDGIKKDFIQKVQEGEKHLFVRKKKVMLVLTPDLARLVASKLRFDEMEAVFEFGTVAEALDSLSIGQAKDIAIYLEEQGYEFLTKALSPDERDQLLLGLLGAKVMPPILAKECQAMAGFASNLTDKQLKAILEGFSEGFLDRLIVRMADKSINSFLAHIKQEIREPLILSFLKDPKLAVVGFRTLPEMERNKYLQRCTPEILATLVLWDTPLAKKKLTDFELPSDYNSVVEFPKLQEREKDMRIGVFKQKFAQAKWNEKEFEKRLTPGEFDQLLGVYMGIKSQDFFNGLDAALRKKLWHEIGEKGKHSIHKKLHHADKFDVLLGNKDLAIEVLVKEDKFLATMVKQGKELEGAGLLLLALKQFNKVESKTGLFKRITNDPKLKEHRMEQLGKLLATPQGKPIYEKITMEVESLKAGYDALICMKKDVEALQSHEELAAAKVTIVDDLVDPSLLQMFEKGAVDVKAFEKQQAEIEKKLKDLLAQLEKSKTRDPMGAYLLESMIILMRMTGQAMKNQLDPKMIEQLDERQKIKNQVLSQVEKRIEELRVEIDQAKANLPKMEEKESKLKEYLQKHEDSVTQKLRSLQERMSQFEAIKAQMQKVDAQKLRVAKVQQQLSFRFFELIRPLVLDKLSVFPASVAKMLSNFKGKTTGVDNRRRIFRFTDEELEKISKRNIVFCSDNEILRRFIVTCLEIDRLEASLFAITDSTHLPEQADILFISEELAEHDFSGVVDNRYKVVFADHPFYQSLAVNEKNKQVIRKALAQLGQNRTKLKSFLENEGANLKKMAATKRNFELQFQTLRTQKRELALAAKDKLQNRAFLVAEQQGFAEKFETIDTKFALAKQSIQTAVQQGGEVLSAIGESTRELNGNLSQTLIEINQELSSLMFMKNVGDTAGYISTQTQEGIAEKMRQNSQVPGGKAKVREIMIAHEGTLASGEVAKSLQDRGANYFGAGAQLSVVQMGRMEAEIKELKKRPQLVLIIADDDKGSLGNLRDLVKALKIQSPQTRFVLFSSYALEEAPQDLVENMNSIRNYAMLINTQLVDYTNPTKIMEFYQQIAPG